MRFKILFSLILLITFSSPPYAQTRAGFTGGINYTGFSGDGPPEGNFSSAAGYSFGVSADFYILEDIVLNIQSVSAHRATDIQFDVKYQYDKFDSISVKTDYFEIPVNIKVIANNGMSYVTAGLSIAYPMHSTATNNRNGLAADVREHFESKVVYANFGVGFQFAIGKPVMFIDLSYSQSVTNLTNGKLSDKEINDKLKSNIFQLYT